MGNRGNNRRWRPHEQGSVWDIPGQWARAWITIFTVLSAAGFIVVILDEIYGWAATGSIIAVIMVMAVVFAVSAVSAFLILRGVNVLIMLAHWIGQQTEKLRAQQKAEGRAEQDAEWRKWYKRQIAQGAALDDPPPTPDSPDGKGVDR